MLYSFHDFNKFFNNLININNKTEELNQFLRFSKIKLGGYFEIYLENSNYSEFLLKIISYKDESVSFKINFFNEERLKLAENIIQDLLFIFKRNKLIEI